ncbi:MAG: hypothetical protein HZC41_00475 [Chloroflexi bacterium]|nr:hypothetical protein [Chloroflexota bacterium]
MTRFFLKLIPVVLIAFLVTNAAARALGTLQPTHPALEGMLDGCQSKTQPCWYGIVPGKTDVQEARNILLSHRLRPVRSAPVYSYFARTTVAAGGCDVELFSAYPFQKVSSVRLQKCSHLALGDILAVVGIPDALHTASARHLWMSFSGGQVALQAQQDPAWSIYAPIKDVWLINTSFFAGKTAHGFMSRARYCQMAVKPPKSSC